MPDIGVLTLVHERDIKGDNSEGNTPTIIWLPQLNGFMGLW